MKAFQPLAPITKEWEEWLIETYHIEICDIYKSPYNFVRTGCKGCPFARNLQKELDTLEEFFPQERKQCEIIWKPVYDEYRRIGYRLKPLSEGKQMTIAEIEGDQEMNKTEYIGRLTSDGKISFGSTGSAFYNNSIAVDRKYNKDGEEKITDFFRFKMFGHGAETFEKYTHKGSKVYLAGRNQIDEYTNKDGQKVRDVVLYVDEFEFLDGKQEQASQNASTTSQNASQSDFLSVPDNLTEELPFL